jgi:SAM-dependent methyltransferase
MAASRPGVLDYLDLWLLRLAKLRRAKHESDEQFYDTFFTEGDVEKYLHDVRNSTRLKRIADTYRALFGDGPARVVDVGCGLGMPVRVLPEAADYLGIEYSQASLALARKAHAGRRAEFRQGGFPDLPTEEASADFTINLEVVEHVPDDAQAVCELGRITRPGGYMLFSVPSYFYWPDYMRLIGHYRHYSRAEIAARMDAAGFEILRGYPQMTAFWRGYHYVYVVFRAFETLVRKTVRRDFAFMDTGFYRWVAQRVENHVARHESRDDARSTFVLCRRTQSAGESPA